MRPSLARSARRREEGVTSASRTAASPLHAATPGGPRVRALAAAAGWAGFCLLVVGIIDALEGADGEVRKQGNDRDEANLRRVGASAAGS